MIETGGFPQKREVPLHDDPTSHPLSRADSSPPASPLSPAGIQQALQQLAPPGLQQLFNTNGGSNSPGTLILGTFQTAFLPMPKPQDLAQGLAGGMSFAQQLQNLFQQG